MSGRDDIPTNERFNDLIFAALDMAVESAKDGSVLPFILIQTGDTKKLHRYLAETKEGGVAQARAALKNDWREEEFRVLVYDGYVTIKQGRFDAIQVEAQELGQGHAVCFAQRYKPRGWLRKFSLIGNPGFIGRIQAFDE